ncbi:hypothetical protein YC2023_042824 [Brassica napus]
MCLDRKIQLRYQTRNLSTLKPRILRASNLDSPQLCPRKLKPSRRKTFARPLQSAGSSKSSSKHDSRHP